MQQGTDLITQLAQIRQRQGLEPMPNPGFIAGFGENDPPSPPPPPLYSHPAPDDDEEPSPLIPPQQLRVKETVNNPVLSEEMVIPSFKLVVMDSMATYAGHQVVLEDSERDQVATIVITAIKRELDQLGSNLQKPGTAFNYAELASYTSAGAPEVKRKRGRPRKNASSSPVA